MESMFKSYFTNNVDISKIPNIASIASEVDGIDGNNMIQYIHYDIISCSMT